MCNYVNTHYTKCGCTVSEQTERCGYQDEDYSECMNWTAIKDLEPREGECGRGKPLCKYQQAVATLGLEPGWKLKDVSVMPLRDLEDVQQRQANVA